MLLFFIATGYALPTPTHNDLRYQYTNFFVTNKTPYPIAITVVYTDGTWKKPTALNVPFILNPNDHYENTLTSERKNNDLMSFVSLEAAQIGNERENYLIFSENGSQIEKRVSSDIRDGLGKIFVGSDINECNQNTENGYAYCTLIVKE